MKKFNQLVFLACGLLLMLAATSVFAQEEKAVQINKKPLEDFGQTVKENLENKQDDQERIFQPNKKPLEDFVQSLQEQIDRKEVDLTKPFSVELEGIFNKDGKLDPKKSKYTKSEGDAMVVNVAKDFIEAVNDTGAFYYLKQLGIENIEFTLGQDEQRTFASIKSEQPTTERARTMVSSLNMLVNMVKAVNDKKLGADEKFIINGAKATNNAKFLLINFDYEKSVVQEMIERKLKESEAKKPSGE